MSKQLCGKLVSRIGFGAAGLGQVYGHTDRKQLYQSVFRAVRLGINYFDTAPFYGGGQSESVLGSALKQLYASEPATTRDSLFLATKVGRYAHGPQGGAGGYLDFSAKRTRDSVQESLTRLQTDYIDLIQCHDIEFASKEQLVQETIPTLLELKQQGIVRGIGLSGYPLFVFTQVLPGVPAGVIDTVLSYAHYTLQNQRLDTELLPWLQHNRPEITVLSASPLALGLLTNQGAPAWHVAEPAIKSACRAVVDYCKQKGVDVAKLGMAFAVAHPKVAVTVMGACTPEEVDANVESLDFPIDPKMIQDIIKLLGPAHNLSWESDASLAQYWKYGSRSPKDKVTL